MDPSAFLQLVWAFLSPLSSQSVSQGCVNLAQSLRSALCVAGLCALVSASWTGLGIAGLVWTGFFVPGLSFFVFHLCLEGCVSCPFVCLPSNGTPVPPLHPLGLSASFLGLPSVLQWLGALAGFFGPLHNWFPSLLSGASVRELLSG